jgi:hypothetical protein
MDTNAHECYTAPVEDRLSSSEALGFLNRQNQIGHELTLRAFWIGEHTRLACWSLSLATINFG